MPFAILNKTTLLLVTIEYKYNLRYFNRDGYKAYPVSNKLAKEIEVWSKTGEHQSTKLTAQILGEIPNKGKHLRNTKSDSFIKDKESAIEYVIQGGCSKIAAELFNVNKDSLRKWVSTRMKSIDPYY